VTEWKTVVSKFCERRKYFSDILRGFFAGEGNIKTGSHSNRTIRIAQKQPMEIIDSGLRELGVTYKFSARERAYVIHGWKNWEKFFRHDIFTLHPDKQKKFIEAWKSYKEIHYPANFIRNNILSELSTPLTCRQLATIFKRKPATLQDVLCEMKVEGKVKNYRSGSLDYWVKSDSNTIVISDRKAKILKLLESSRKVNEVADLMDIGWKAARKRLGELEKLGLAKQENYLWRRVPTNKEVLVL
jgi:DNA-binding transcriptional regulator YhcF (GntR family)